MVSTTLFVLSCICSASAQELTTLRTYTLDVPGSDPIQIFEGDPLWGKKETAKRIFTTPPSTTHPLGMEQDGNDEEFSSSALQKFLDSYAEKIRKDKFETQSETVSKPTTEEKGKKSWDLMNLRHHNHPYDDRTGWVTLDPVPWSMSKISKWQSKPRPTQDSWTSYERPFNDYDDFYLSTGNANKDTFQHYQSQNGKPNQIRPSNTKPTASFGHTVHMQLSPNNNRNPIKYGGYSKRGQNCNDHELEDGILTDGQPLNFPNRLTNRRLGTEAYPPSHPFTGNGDWVLLSTSTGYKYPKKQRAIKFNPESISAHKSVHLTVLPPLKGSKVNMTTSHGGLLQVESTFESVEQSQRKQQKQQKLQKLKTKRKRPVKLVKKKKRPQSSKVVTESAIATVPRSTAGDGDSSAVLAGVGAGLIPATMAMLVPLAMNGRKRRKRNVFSTSIPSSLEVTLQRSL